MAKHLVLSHQKKLQKRLKEGFDIDKRKIELDGTIKTIGSYRITIKLHSEVSVKINLEVEAI